MTAIDNEPKRPPRRRPAAAAYIAEKTGGRCSTSHLAKLAVKGTGPAYRYYNRYPIYDEADLDAYIESRTSAKVHSTSGLGPRDYRPSGRPRKAARALEPA